jgi:hypothetical protein
MRSHGNLLNSELGQSARGRVYLSSSRLARLWRVAPSLYELSARAEAGAVSNTIIRKIRFAESRSRKPDGFRYGMK